MWGALQGVGSGPHAPRGAAYIPPWACVVVAGGTAGAFHFHLLKNGHICKCVVPSSTLLGNQLLIVADPVTEYLGHHSSHLSGWPWLPRLSDILDGPPSTARRQRQEDASSPYVARLIEPGHRCSRGKRLLDLGGRGRDCTMCHIRFIPGVGGGVWGGQPCWLIAFTQRKNETSGTFTTGASSTPWREARFLLKFSAREGQSSHNCTVPFARLQGRGVDRGPEGY